DIGLRKDVAGSWTQVIDVANRRTYDVEPAAIFSGVTHSVERIMRMNFRKSTSALRRAARALPALLLAACAACTSLTPTERPTRDTAALEQRARAAADAGNFSAAVDLYTQLATASGGSARIDYLLQAARFAADYGDTALARRRVGEARNGASVAQQQTSTVLLARLELAEGRPQAALDMLAALPQALPDQTRSDATAVRGQALFRVGKPVDAVRTLVDREVWLGDAASIIANQRMIWDGFRASASPPPPAQTGDAVVDGWLALAPLTSSSGPELRRSLLGWRQTYPSHPAAGGLLAELLAAQRSTAFPSQIALLLPLSSQQRAFALAIQDGFMAAHLKASGNSATSVRVYDSAKLGSAEAYLQAQLDGADFVVGPLGRTEVDQVIAQAGFVPTLALNYATNDTNVLRGFYQFALAPEDEARAIAAAAIAAGAKTAVAFVVNNQGGYRIRDAFSTAFQEAGGKLVDWYGYEPALQDFSQPTATLLNVRRSNERKTRLAANLGEPVQFEARRREDIDMIFAVVPDDRTGRLIASQLRFFGAGDIPVYANAAIFDPGKTARDNDLNGFIFADTPALVAPDAEAAALRADLQAYWPARAGLARYYGMGFDAYGLVASLYGNDGARWSMRGLSGDLSLDEQGRVRRVLPLAQFRSGRPVALDVQPSQPIESGRLIGQR
ncbi:MAG TPA: penicillin-binding protein activator, partial [Gammaproteobacteria bacterium]|nr:penicillin-binding protein activator [Gammaproteobacteria bacterium]